MEGKKRTVSSAITMLRTPVVVETVALPLELSETLIFVGKLDGF